MNDTLTLPELRARRAALTEEYTRTPSRDPRHAEIVRELRDLDWRISAIEWSRRSEERATARARKTRAPRHDWRRQAAGDR